MSLFHQGSWLELSTNSSLFFFFYPWPCNSALSQWRQWQASSAWLFNSVKFVISVSDISYQLPKNLEFPLRLHLDAVLSWRRRSRRATAEQQRKRYPRAAGQPEWTHWVRCTYLARAVRKQSQLICYWEFKPINIMLHLLVIVLLVVFKFSFVSLSALAALELSWRLSLWKWEFYLYS